MFETINVGTVPNDGTGDPLRTAFQKCNQNFDAVDDEVLGVTLTGLNVALVGSLTSADSVLSAFGRLEHRMAINDGKVSFPFGGSQTANRVAASPDGSNGALAMRALVANDIPVLGIAKIGSVDPGVLLGRYAASPGVMQEITLGAGLSLNASTGVLTAGAGYLPLTGGTLTGGLVAPQLTLGTSGILTGGVNLIEQRNGINAQRFNVYSTFTDSSNYKRLSVYHGGNDYFIDADSAGTGTSSGDFFLRTVANHAIRFSTNATIRWSIENAGLLQPLADNAYNLGAPSQRVASGYFGTGLVTQALQVIGGATNGYVLTSDGVGNATWQAAAGGGGGAVVVAVTGNPEGVVTDNPLTIGIDVSTRTIWVKETGTGNTGWFQYV